MTISKQRLVEDLKRIGVNTGDHLAVGISFKSLGRVTEGPNTVVEALTEAVGPDGTVMMNTHTKVFNLTEVRLGWTDYVYDARVTPCITGIVSEKLRQRENALRSRHPAYSIAAIGKQAHFLTDGHDEHAAAYLPYAKLAQIEGKYLAVGVGDKLAGFRHRAQQEAGLLDIVSWDRAVNYKDQKGSLQTFILKDRGGCIHRLPELVTDLRAQGLVKSGRVGMAAAILVPARESLERMTGRLKENPAINLCKNPFCLWCREIERKLNLYPKIERPKIFQKNKAVIYFFAFINRIRELDNRFITKAKLKLRDCLEKYGII